MFLIMISKLTFSSRVFKVVLRTLKNVKYFHLVMLGQGRAVNFLFEIRSIL